MFFRTKKTATVRPAPPAPINPLSEQAIQAFLVTRGLAVAACPLYAQEMTILIQTLTALNEHSAFDITTVLTTFNLAFTHQSISSESPFVNPLLTSGSEPHETMGDAFQSVDPLFIDHIRQEFHDSTVGFDKTMYAALLQVYTEMEACRTQYKLIYHQPRHAIEVFSDLHFLLRHNVEKVGYEPFHLLMVLCGLFHDIRFTHHRVIDEKASATALKSFLQPIIVNLMPLEKSLIFAIIDVIIIGSTIPCMLSKNRLGEPNPTFLSLFEVTLEFLMVQRISFNHPLIIGAARLISIADIQRSSVPLLLENHPCYRSDEWARLTTLLFDEISPADLLSEKCKFSQGFRTIAEMNTAATSGLHQFSTIVACLQSGLDHHEIEVAWKHLVPALADLIGKGMYSEISFAIRMDNTSTEQANANPIYALIDAVPRQIMHNRWPQHQHALKKLYAYLTNADITLDEKARLVLDLAHVTVNQDGAQFTAAKVTNLIAEIKTISSQPTRAFTL